MRRPRRLLQLHQANFRSGQSRLQIYSSAEWTWKRRRERIESDPRSRLLVRRRKQILCGRFQCRSWRSVHNTRWIFRVFIMPMKQHFSAKNALLTSKAGKLSSCSIYKRIYAAYLDSLFCVNWSRHGSTSGKPFISSGDSAGQILSYLSAISSQQETILQILKIPWR